MTVRRNLQRHIVIVGIFIILAGLAITELPYAFATVYLGESFLKGESTLFILLGVFLFKVVRKPGRRELPR